MSMDEEFERHPIKAAIVGIIYFVLLVVIALVSISMITSGYPDFEYIFEDVTTNIIIFGALAAVLAAVTAYFDKGEIYRMISGVAKIGALAVYIYTFITGLNLTIDMDQVSAEIAIPGILMLIMILMVVKAGYFLLEYYIYGVREEKQKEEENPFMQS